MKQKFESIDPSVEVDGSGLISYKLGIALFAPFAKKKPDEPVVGVTVFREGYYD